MSDPTDWPQPPPPAPARQDAVAEVKGTVDGIQETVVEVKGTVDDVKQVVDEIQLTVEAIVDALVEAPPSGDTKAIASLTYTGTALTDGDTVTIGTQTYTFKTLLTGSPDEVLIGATTDSLAYLKAAVNGEEGAGVTYGEGTVANADAIATILTGTTALAFEALVAGVDGNTIAIAEASTNLTWDAGATFTGGE